MKECWDITNVITKGSLSAEDFKNKYGEKTSSD